MYKYVLTFSYLLLSVQQCEAIQSTAREMFFLSKEAALFSYGKKILSSFNIDNDKRLGYLFEALGLRCFRRKTTDCTIWTRDT